MQVRKFIIAAALIILITIVCFIPFENKTGVAVHTSLYDVAKQINDLNNWKKWSSELKRDDIKITGSSASDQSATIKSGCAYTLHHINPLAIILTRKDAKTSIASLIEISPLADTAAYIRWNEKLSVFDLLRKNVAAQSMHRDFTRFKNLMENAQLKYGFPIHLVPVTDTLLLTIIATASPKKNIVSLLYQQLVAYININDLPAEKNYFYKTDLDSHKIAVCIPVYKKINNTDSIKVLELPATGKLIEATYSGTLINKPTFNTAVKNFMIDEHLKQVAQPLEQYNTSDTVFEKGKSIHIKVFYPVF